MREQLAARLHAEWDEALHPRDHEGQFAHKGAGAEFAVKDWGWAKRTLGPLHDSLTTAQRAAASAYSGSAYKPVNRSLRRGTPQSSSRWSEAEVAGVIADLDGAMRASKLPEPVVLWRGIAEGAGLDLHEGATITDDAFLSTTVNRATAESWGDHPDAWTVELHVPANVGAVVVPVELGGEQEVILDRGLPMRVISVNGRRVVMEVARHG